MASTSQTFSLRPWPTGDKKPKNISEFIARMNTECGGFRNVKAADLRKEIEAQKNGIVAEDVNMDAESESEDAENRPTMPEVMAARDETIRNIDIAHRNCQLAVDTVSLLLSKEIPVPASMTLTPLLRELVGIGTLGAEHVAATNVTDDKLRDNKTVVTGWKFLDIAKTVDSVMSSASRLQKVMEREKKYWAGVLAVSESGWSVSSLPDGRGVQVKFGFSEAAAGFGEKRSAPLKLNYSGEATLLRSGAVGRSQRLFVCLSEGGKIVGRSDLPKPLAVDATVDLHVLEARNTIFARELWHELNREGRTLLSHNVRVDPNSITIPTGPRTELTVKLIALDAPLTGIDAYGSYPQDAFVESISSALHILLSYAHRQNNQRRSQPTPPIANQNRSTPTYSLLRPIIAHLEHEKHITHATEFIAALTTILRSTGLSTASYTLVEPPTSLHLLNRFHRISPSEALCTTLLNPREFHFEVVITPEARISVRGTSLTAPFIAQHYQIYLPSPPTRTNGRNPIEEAFPPNDSYPSIREVSYYIRHATARVLALNAEKLALRMQSEAPLGQTEQTASGWRRNLTGTTIYDLDNQFREIRFSVCRAGSSDRWDENEAESGRSGPADSLEPELRVYAAWPERGAGKMSRLRWQWTAEAARDGVSPGSLDTIVRSCVLGKAASS